MTQRLLLFIVSHIEFNSSPREERVGGRVILNDAVFVKVKGKELGAEGGGG